MKKFILSLALICPLASRLQGGVVLDTTNPPGMPLTMNSGSVSGSMYVTANSDNNPNDVMAAWNVQLQISAIAGATGTLSFQTPATGTPPAPTNYIFGSDGLGITVANSGSILSANDFFDPAAGLGAAVPSAPGANLLELDFLASSNASGLFGIYADEGIATTQWTDSNFTTQIFSNAPDGTGTVLIGEVMVTPSGVQPVPEPSSLTLLWMGAAVLASWNCWRKRTNNAA